MQTFYMYDGVYLHGVRRFADVDMSVATPCLMLSNYSVDIYSIEGMSADMAMDMDMVWHRVARCGMARCGAVWRGVAWYGDWRCDVSYSQRA